MSWLEAFVAELARSATVSEVFLATVRFGLRLVPE